MITMQDALLAYIYNAGGTVSIRHLADTFGFRVDAEFVSALVHMETQGWIVVDECNVDLTERGREIGRLFLDLACQMSVAGQN